jgi:predicted enzyme related to lactoylglutathione lyase
MISEMMARGTFASINLATTDVDGTFERLQAGDAEVVRNPPTSRTGSATAPSATPAGNLIRIQELR